MAGFIERDNYDALVRWFGGDSAMEAVVGNADEVLVVEPAEDGGKPKTVLVLERCNDGEIRERPPGMPWPMRAPVGPSTSDYIAFTIGYVALAVYAVFMFGVLVGLWP